MSLLLALLLAQSERTDGLGIRLVRVEPGEFVQGAGEAPPRTREEWRERDWDEAPARRVRITRAFEIGVTEVTVAQFAAFDPAHPRPRGAKDDEPVVRVSWERARDFCAWMSEREQRPYRLPTEAEWEFVAGRGGAPGNLASDGLLPVGRFAPNALGLRDLFGNAAEWCADLYGPYDPDDGVDPVGAAEGFVRVVRGGSFLTSTLRASDRSGHLPDDANRATGFRVAVGEAPATSPRRAPAVAGPWEERPTPTIPKDSWGPLFSAWNHYAAVTACPNGDLLAAWYTTVGEEGRELAQASSRRRAGSEHWEAARPFLDVPDVNDHAPVLLTQGKRVLHFFTQSLRGWDDASDWMRVSEDSGATWSAPRLVWPREGALRLSQPCSAIAMRDGTIALAVDGDGHREERILLSGDGGTTWRAAGGELRRALGGAYAIHPAIAEGSDGAILCFLRGPDPLPLLVSKDRGETWEARPTPFSPLTVGQKCAALRLASGALLLVSHDSKKRSVGGVFAALSFDDGATWPHVRRLEGADGYLSAAQGGDGRIHVVGSKMGATSFLESWLREAR